ncbi:hypothetical protein HYFRA_00013030 [Hymenoscyphus fraxineus]|uniref:Uncharacterized protein n=1 Tax=Hymenoscyphus fraxineus TaxID=746836 RepID=A0A9N9PTI5_9HELO|nr:hypothetical protein HYFRA_00013030 [Hymenoscyphus fraxineus]
MGQVADLVHRHTAERILGSSWVLVNSNKDTASGATSPPLGLGSNMKYTSEFLHHITDWRPEHEVARLVRISDRSEEKDGIRRERCIDVRNGDLRCIIEILVSGCSKRRYKKPLKGRIRVNEMVTQGV